MDAGGEQAKKLLSDEWGEDAVSKRRTQEVSVADLSAALNEARRTYRKMRRDRKREVVLVHIVEEEADGGDRGVPPDGSPDQEGDRREA